ncbi:MAG: hypothetical protein JKY94_02825 [Rhodobacteraceae bacterium]|nr:hypothetical protein [Paracoccaceae bacterium]
MTPSFLSIVTRFVPLVLAIGLIGTPLRAEVPITYTDAGRALFRFDAPDFWTIRTGGARQLSAPDTEDERGVSRLIGLSPTADPHVWIGFVSPQGISNFAEGVEYLRDIGPSLVKDPVTTSRKERRVNGLKVASFAGTGTRKGKTVNFTAILIDLPGGRIAVSVVVMEPGFNADTLGAVNAIFNSFRAVR